MKEIILKNLVKLNQIVQIWTSFRFDSQNNINMAIFMNVYSTFFSKIIPCAFLAKTLAPCSKILKILTTEMKCKTIEIYFLLLYTIRKVPFMFYVFSTKYLKMLAKTNESDKIRYFLPG